jgi:hypothetical protein
MPNDTPQTLPADFFSSKKQGATPPETLPSDFFSKKEAESSTAKSVADQGTISAQPSMFQKIKSGAKSVAMDPFNLPSAIGSMTSGIENYTQEGRKEHPVLSRVGDVTKAGKDYAELLATTLGITGGAGILGPEAEIAQGEALAAKQASKLQKVNEALGVKMGEIKPGKLPASLDEFEVNPARGALKAGFDEKKLAKLDDIERYNAMTKAKDATGKQLGQLLDQAGKQGKTVDAYSIITKAFSKFDATEVAKAEKVLQEGMAKHGIDIAQLDKLTPAQAQALKQDLWDSGEVGKQLYRGISEGIKKAVPEAKDVMRDYQDLMGAEKAARRGAQKFATKAPESELRKMFKKHVVPRISQGIGGGLGAGAAYVIYRAVFGGKGSTPAP